MTRRRTTLERFLEELENGLKSPLDFWFELPTEERTPLQLRALELAFLQVGPWNETHLNQVFLELGLMLDAEEISDFQQEAYELWAEAQDSGDADSNPIVRALKLKSNETLRFYLDPFGLNEVVDGFHIVERLGSGANSVVFRAIEVASGKCWAIKAPKNYTYIRIPWEGPLHAEVLAGRAMNGEGYPRDYQARKLTNGMLVATMEFVEGTSLLDLHLQESDFSKTMSKTARIVHRLHRAGRTHGDLKPNHVSVQKNGDVKLLDLGGSTVIADRNVDYGGTAGFRSLEVAMGEQLLNSARSDIASLGRCMAWHFKVPLNEERKDAPVRVLTLLDASHPESSILKLSHDWQTIIQGCVADNFFDRYPSALMLAEDLKRVAQNESLPAIPMLHRNKREVLGHYAGFLVGLTRGLAVIFSQHSNHDLPELAEDIRRTTKRAGAACKRIKEVSVALNGKVPIDDVPELETEGTQDQWTELVAWCELMVNDMLNMDDTVSRCFELFLEITTNDSVRPMKQLAEKVKMPKTFLKALEETNFPLAGRASVQAVYLLKLADHYWSIEMAAKRCQ